MANTNTVPSPSRRRLWLAPEETEIRGVFSTQETRKVGTGMTSRRTTQKLLWFVEQKGDVLEAQPITSNHIPSGPKRRLTLDELLTQFTPEPELFVVGQSSRIPPSSPAVARTTLPTTARKNVPPVKGGPSASSSRPPVQAESNLPELPTLDVQNARVNFGIGIACLERGDKPKAKDVLHRLAQIKAKLLPEHKPLFNEFGITCRKSGLPVQSVEFYRRALQVGWNDEGLYMNLARALFDAHQVPACVDMLVRALEVSPTHEPSRLFLAWLTKKGLVPKGKSQAVSNVLELKARKK